MAVIQVVDGGGDSKSTSGLKSFAKRLGKVFAGSEALKDFWRTARDALDTVAGAANIPLSQLRQSLRNAGVEPDRFNSALTETWLSSPPDNKQTPALALDIQSAEENAKMPVPAIGLIAVGLGVLFLVLSLKRRGRSRSRKRGRSRRR